ncbi:hypothetical protein CKAH01_05995 [Colletotrichum kahawae]|uniref:Uncharacterized protein n=1 Tax=Colletotrichum kahawae TaxID=34407 RepID=A0AAD9Y9Q8_COLKA|nr:hypothetical protein CKAH01_05995 [Colletotrichum kahawae]
MDRLRDRGDVAALRTAFGPVGAGDGGGAPASFEVQWTPAKWAGQMAVGGAALPHTDRPATRVTIQFSTIRPDVPVSGSPPRWIMSGRCARWELSFLHDLRAIDLRLTSGGRHLSELQELPPSVFPRSILQRPRPGRRESGRRCLQLKPLIREGYRRQDASEGSVVVVSCAFNGPAAQWLEARTTTTTTTTTTDVGPVEGRRGAIKKKIPRQTKTRRRVDGCRLTRPNLVSRAVASDRLN